MQLWDSLALDQTIKKCFYDKITDTKNKRQRKLMRSEVILLETCSTIFAQISIACFENKQNKL